ncbi:sensor histidine kinase [Microvirga tunisiensis]|uniref:Blue-light-activated histidine kinase n=1 Tax=Microvirga tunisiensis TaxID=2108360 RepID=A0A5N7MM64_9HYPH|nr:HWE histidine kinase domain-containing protein [Microvirga tunisiensis]MPR06888.1 PAS domain S-box protein [Microvirga tunisiensis]MPR25056.1 PAS domain S-box protein [Microvirga tunisiensis]
MTLTRRLLLLALISVLPAIVIWTYTEVSLRRAREAEVNDLAIRQAQLVGAELERVCDGIHSLLLAVDETPSIRAFDTAACSPYLKAIQEKVPYILSFVAMDISGHIRCRPLGTIDTQHYFADRAYFHEALSRLGFVVGDYTPVFEEGGLAPQPVLPLALPIWNDRGDVVGVLAAALDLAWLNQKVKERTVPENGSVTVADRRGIMIVQHPHPERMLGKLLPQEYLAQASAKTIGTAETISADGLKRIVGYIPLAVPPRDIYVNVGLSTKAAFASINQAARRGFMLIAAALILALSLSALLSRAFITKPFEIVTDGIRAWRQGDYQARIDLPGKSGEFGILGRAFNDLMDDVAERQHALQASEERARLALEAGHMGTWWYDPNKGVGGWSTQATAMLGFPHASEVMDHQHWLDILHPEDLDRVVRKWHDSVKNQGDYQDEYRIRLPNGDLRWINSRGRVFFDIQKRPVYFIGIFQDITEQKHAEEQQRFFLDELNHRVKNTLTTVQSIASQTLRTTETSAQFKEAFEGRLLALSKTHNLLTRKSWREAELRDVAEQELAPYRKQGDERVVLNGPNVRLPARYAINLGLVLHELVTNAAKYGALSTNAGHLDMNWTVVQNEDRPDQLRIHWTESGGPPVAPPKRQGFGSRLIRRSIEGELGGYMVLNFAEGGVSYDISVPLAHASKASDSKVDSTFEINPVLPS